MVPKKKASDSNINAGTPKELPDETVKRYDSNMVSMSTSTSPISSGPTNTGTQNSSMAQCISRHSFHLLIIHTWRVADSEFQCHFA
jgi:hypothetical protein